MFLKSKDKFAPFKLERIDENSIRLKSLDKNESQQTICLTDLSDLFQEKPENHSKIYKTLIDYTWYPTKVFQHMGSNILLDDNSPAYYLKKNALKINGNKSYYKDNFLISENSICKFTNNSIYIFDVKEKELKASLQFTQKDINKIKLFDILNIVEYDFKKIDETILINENDLPIEIRLNCDQTFAEEKFKEYLIQISNSSYVYDIKSITINKINGCSFEFSIIRRSREYYDIYRRLRFKFDFLENSRYRITPL